MKKKTRASGVITFHAPLPVSLWKSEECMADMQGATDSRKSSSQPRAGTGKCVRAEKRDEASPSETQEDTRQSWLSHTSLRRLQEKVKAESQQAKDIIQPLLDTENGLVKEVEIFLSKRDVAELRKRELQHKRWTERVWFPLQRRLEEQVSRCCPVEAKRCQSLYSHFLHHCNTKGFVFLETYDPREYNPFLLNIKEHNTANLKDQLCLQLHERLTEKRAARSCEAGFKYKLPQSNCPLSDSVASRIQASPNYPVSRKSPVKDETKGGKTNRLDTIPEYISETAVADGRCHQTSCWFSRPQVYISNYYI